ncbi:MAG: tetratricopeptide repeat protein [Gemmatimonadaceae bacterium]
MAEEVPTQARSSSCGDARHTTHRSRYPLRALLPLIAAVFTIADCSQPLHGGLPLSLPYSRPRPKLAAGADTNSADAYYEQGNAWLRADRLDSAASAYFWAARLAPDWAEPLYALRIALHGENLAHIPGYLASGASIRSPGVRQIDSLEREARLRNPFLHARYDYALTVFTIDKVTDGRVRAPMPIMLPPGQRGWVMMSQGDFTRAAELYALAIQRDTLNFALHGERARAFFLLNEYDSALTEMALMRRKLASIQASRTLPIFLSASFAEYATGAIHAARGDYKAAREAYERALTDDLAFYMAHTALGDVSMRLGDTTNALSEYALAVEIRGDDPSLRYRYGSALLTARHPADAAVQLRRAIALDPDDRRSYLAMTYIAEFDGDDAAVVTWGESFLARAPRTARPQIEAANGMIAAAKARLAKH